MEEYGTIWNDETTTRIKSKIVSPEPVAKKKETVGARFFTVFTASCWC